MMFYQLKSLINAIYSSLRYIWDRISFLCCTNIFHLNSLLRDKYISVRIYVRMYTYYVWIDPKEGLRTLSLAHREIEILRKI